MKRKYGFANFCLDVFMMIVTCGFWIIWIIVREARG